VKKLGTLRQTKQGVTLSLFKWGTTSASENYALNVVVSSMFHYIISDMVF
jgi:hypothetical protein